MPPLLIDTHVHLDDSSYDADRDVVVERAVRAGVRMQVIPGIDAANWPAIRALCNRYEGLHAAYGLHPLMLARHCPEHLDDLRTWLGDGRAVAVGEIGLDYFVEALDREAQQRLFEAQLAIACEFDLPVIVHARRALEQVLLTLRRYPGLRGVVHSFAGSEQQADGLCQLGFMLGIGGPVTYERARKLRRVVRHVPAEHLLLETDSPDQPLAGHQGRRNEPARVAEVLHCLAELRDESVAQLAATTTANARRLFGLQAGADSGTQPPA